MAHAPSSDVHPPHRRPTGQSVDISLSDDACDLGADLCRLRLRTGLDSGLATVHDHSIESLADQVPEPWGARLEIMLRELGGMIWIQIATAIVLLRLIVWVPFHIWRLRRERPPALS